ncbi:MAG: hypothetical protein PHY31_00430, partial [Smithellaceae bacterium]|nr:hypothetical protein [Smithellaceae bacterium]
MSTEESPYLAEIDLQFGSFMQRLAGAADCIVLAAAALASRATREGHVCLNIHDLGHHKHESLKSEFGFDVTWPAEHWLATLRSSPVVGLPGEYK